jgi:TetR/AcrR family transcriptional regulator
MTELRGYIRRKLEMARDYPRESRLFANEILQGAPRIMPMLEGELRALVDEKVDVIRGWMRAGRIARTDPFHLVFSIWATTQHYADFDVQVRAVLGPDRGGEGRFEDAARFLESLFVKGLSPRPD